MAIPIGRRWLRPPQLRTLDADQGERHATWLELFFDLVFVISIAEVAHTLEDYRTPADFLGTAGLFVAVWWAWVGYTVYADRFDTDDLLHRALVLAGMLAVIAMALSVHDALHGGSARFALTFVAVRGIVLVLNARARRHAAPARPLLNLFLAAFSTGAALWLLSLLLPEPARYVLWGVALVIELSTPWVGRRQVARAPVHASHLVERLGLFTLIVLGESVVRVAQAVAHVQDWTAATLAAAGGGFLLVAGCGGCTSTASTRPPSAARSAGSSGATPTCRCWPGWSWSRSASSTRSWTPQAAGWNGRRPLPSAAGRRCTCSRPW
jgi:low temperature requirement protein LtrA